MTLFFALCFVGVAVAGFSAFVIFWPLTLVHVRDRHPALAARFGSGAFLKPDALAWLTAQWMPPAPPLLAPKTTSRCAMPR